MAYDRYAPLTVPYETLKPSYKAFIEYFIQTQNASESARRAGYSEKSANKTGQELKCRLMPYIQDRLIEIKKMEDEKTRSLIADTNEIMSILTRIARGEEKDAFGLDTSNQDKLKALELLGKANQLYVDRVKQDTNVDINVNLLDDNEEPKMIDSVTTDVEVLEEEETKLLGEGEE